MKSIRNALRPEGLAEHAPSRDPTTPHQSPFGRALMRSAASVSLVLLLAVAAQAMVAVPSTRAGDDHAAVAPEPAAQPPAQADAPIAEFVRSAVDELLAQGPIEVHYMVTGAEAGTAVGSGLVDIAARSYDLAETVSGEGFSFTHERRLIGDALYIRDVFEGDDPAAAPWSEIPYGPESERELDGALTARGRALPGLARLVLLVEQLPFEVTSSADGSAHTLTIPVDAVRAFYAETGLQQVQMWDESFHGHEEHDETPVGFEVEVDGHGALAHLRAFGSVFHDGELLEDAEIDIRFSPTKPAAIEAPEERSST
jgi:hypothetical protein